MIQMKRTFKIFTLFLLVTSFNVFGQEFNVPSNVALNTVEDYKKAEPLVLQSIDWLQNTPVTKDTRKRAEVNAFLMKWMTGSPSVTIELVAGIVPMECSDCLMAFLSGWTKYSLEHDYSKDKIANAVAGAEHAIEFYKKNKKELGKQKEFETMIRRQKKGKLQAYIESKF